MADIQPGGIATSRAMNIRCWASPATRRRWRSWWVPGPLWCALRPCGRRPWSGRLSRPPIHLGGRAMTDYRVVRSRRRTVAPAGRPDRQRGSAGAHDSPGGGRSAPSWKSTRHGSIASSSVRPGIGRSTLKPTPQEQGDPSPAGQGSPAPAGSPLGRGHGRPPHRDQDHLRPDTIWQLLRENSLCFSLCLMAYPRRPSSMWWCMSWPISAIKTTVPPSTPRWRVTCRTGGSGRPC